MEAQAARAHTKRKLKFTLPGPMTISDTIADRHYGDQVKMAFAFADLLNQEARALERDGVDVIQFDEPAFNVFTGQVAEWGVEALQRAAAGLTCKTAVHICYGYGIKANTDWKDTLGGEWRQYEAIFPAIAKSKIDQVSVECRNSKVPLELLSLLKGKDILVGVIDVASDTIETPEDIVATIEAAMKFVPKDRFRLHQLRHGADASRHRGGEAQCARRRRGAAKIARSATAIRSIADCATLRAAEHVHQFGDLAALIGAVAGRDRALDAMRDMIAQDFLLDAAQGRAHG